MGDGSSGGEGKGATGGGLRGSAKSGGTGRLLRALPLRRGRARAGDARSRNIVGTLLGHLTSARRQLAEETGAGAVELPAGHRRGEEDKEREAQLLHQRLQGHYTHMKGFIRTQAEPTIFYLPAKHTPETERALNETRTAIEQKIRALRAHLRGPPDTAEAPEKEPDHYVEPSREDSSSSSDEDD